MEQLIDKKYNIGNLVQLRFAVSDISLVCDASNIIFLKIGDKIIINKYLDHPSRNLFPLSNEPVSKVGEHTLYNYLFELDKDYIVYEGQIENKVGYLFQLRFGKTFNGIKYSNEMLSPQGEKPEVQTVDIEKINSFFDYNNYDSLYIFTNDGELYLSYNSKDSKGNYIPHNSVEIECASVEELAALMPLKIVSSKDGEFEVRDVVYFPVNDGNEFALTERIYQLPKSNNRSFGPIPKVQEPTSNGPKF